MSKPALSAETLRERLEPQLGPVEYSDLAAHLGRDALFVVAPGLSLLECAIAVAQDDVDRVGAWLKSGELRKPTAAERRDWPTEEGRLWMSVPVRPFVLVQTPPDA